MDKKDLICYAYGIHIGRLTENDTEKILREYYNIEYLPEISFLNENKKNKEVIEIKGIYDWALYIMLLNGYRLPFSKYNCESINSSLYFKDMSLLLYLYTINQKDSLSSNKLMTSSSTNRELFYIEQSGFGNILGIRRENKYERGNVTKEERKKVKYVPTIPNKWKDCAIEGSKYSIIRNEKKSEYSISFACRNVVVALLKSRKYNRSIFFSEKEEKLSEEEAKKIIDGDSDLLKKFLHNIPVEIFGDDIQERIKLVAIMGGGVHKKLFQYVNQSKEDVDVDVDVEYKFYDRYFRELDKSEMSWKNVGKYDSKTNIYIKKANRYLSESVFAYLYYARACLKITSYWSF